MRVNPCKSKPEMQLLEFLDIYSPVTLIAYDGEKNVLAAVDSDNKLFIILVKITPITYVALTNYDDAGIASNEFRITADPIGEYQIIYEDSPCMEFMCSTAISWAVRMKHDLKTTDDYHIVEDHSRPHPFLRSIYEEYFYDLNTAICVLTELIIHSPNFSG